MEESEKELIPPSRLVSLVNNNRMRNQLSCFVLDLYLPPPLVKICHSFFDDEKIDVDWSIQLDYPNHIPYSHTMPLEFEKESDGVLTLVDSYEDIQHSSYELKYTVVVARIERRLSNFEYVSHWHTIHEIIFKGPDEVENLLGKTISFRESERDLPMENGKNERIPSSISIRFYRHTFDIDKVVIPTPPDGIV